MTVDPSEYEKEMPIVAAFAKIERVVYRTRASHAGQPFAAVHQTLAEALQDEGAQRVVHGQPRTPTDESGRSPVVSQSGNFSIFCP
ncbi:hypothetical protein [Streptomyces sp. NPDC054829]